MAVVGESGSTSLDRNEFNVFLALVGLAQKGDIVSLDSVDEHRQSKLVLLFGYAPRAK